MGERGRALRIIRAGALSTVQDEGRRGVAQSGVSPSGSADWFAARTANGLAGNANDVALIETTLNGIVFVADCDMHIAITGADAPIHADGMVLACWRAHDLRAGTRVTVGTPRSGFRSYVAVDGGIQVAPLLGSRATDVAGGFGGKILRDGDVLGLGPASPSQRGGPIAMEQLHYFGTPPTVLRAMAGPHAARLGTAALDDLCATAYAVSPRSSRQAIRLDGRPLRLRESTDVISCGVTNGSVQITSDGLPIVLLAEHQSTGGYAIAACVITADLPKAAQLRPGDALAFRLVGFPEAVDARAELEATLDSLLTQPDLKRPGFDMAPRLARGFAEGLGGERLS